MRGASEIGPPEKLSSDYDLSAFDSGEPTLDDCLQRRAERNEASGTSRTYVVCIGRKVIGYYTLAAGAIAVDNGVVESPSDPLTVMITVAEAAEMLAGQTVESCFTPTPQIRFPALAA